ncbi:potassium channel family protein [Aquabacter cavernae]|uniref:potassium channel family protein n=1 Tax=Aquabacter cavernae TaxID=2496029 RepID=UPI000F8E665C|nr:potassium channel family protein [Aquabacter cavernae]
MGDSAVFNAGWVPVELVYGLCFSLVNIAIHCVVIVSLVRFMRGLQRKDVQLHRVLALALTMMLTTAVLTLSHMIQVWIWAGAYTLVGSVKEGDAYYFAFVNFTTLGYGDVLGVPRWRILGPITAANGMLLFGSSTALMFAVLTRAGTMLHVYDPAPARKRPVRRKKPARIAEASIGGPVDIQKDG